MPHLGTHLPVKIYPLLHFKFVMNYNVYHFIIIITNFYEAVPIYRLFTVCICF